MADEQRISVVPAMCANGVLLVGVLLVFLGTLFAVPAGATVWIVIGMGVYALAQGGAFLWLIHAKPGLFTRPEPPRRPSTSEPTVTRQDIEAVRDELGQRLGTLDAAVTDLATKLAEATKPKTRSRARR